MQCHEYNIYLAPRSPLFFFIFKPRISVGTMKSPYKKKKVRVSTVMKKEEKENTS